MIPFISVAIGKLNTLLTRVPSDNATRIAYLTGPLSDRAPASTALSTSVWTTALAGNVGYLSAYPFLYDPRYMPMLFSTPASVLIKVSSGDGDLANTTTWSNLESMYAVQSVTGAGAYVTVLDITSGAGVLSHVVGPLCDGSYTTTIRITVDTRVYTIAAANNYTSPRFMLGSFESVQRAFSVVDGLARQRESGVLTSPDDAIIFAPQTLLRYNSSLKVEVQVSTLPASTNPNRKCLVIYRALKGTAT